MNTHAVKNEPNSGDVNVEKKVMTAIMSATSIIDRYTARKTL